MSGAKQLPGHKAPPMLSGVRANARAGKKRAAAAAATTTTKLNGLANGVQHAPKIKVEDDMADLESLAESTTTADADAARASIDVRATTNNHS